MTANDTNETRRPAAGEVYDSLTWHDETAIETAFDVSVHDLMAEVVDDDVPTSIKTLVALVRAFELVHHRREGLGDREALAKVRLLTNGEASELLEAYFGGDDEEQAPEPLEIGDVPASPAGEGDAAE